MKVSVGARTDVGRARTVNQDVYLAEDPLYGVADGMGGHLAGDVASATAVETVKAEFDRTTSTGPDDLARYLDTANAAVWAKSNEDPGFEGMGTTFTLVHLDGNRAAIAHVGDSRAYLLRDDRLEQITEDHTLVERMVREGRLERAEAAHHPQRNVITRALGIDAELEVDRFEFEVRGGDRLLICSDGLNSMLDDSAIADLLAQSTVQEAADALVDAANQAGGEDNITVVILGFDPDETAGQTAAAPVAVGSQRATTEPTPNATGSIGTEARSTRRWRRLAIVSGLVVVLLVGLAVGGRSLVLSNSWYVGADESGAVAIYRGIPEEVLGVNLSDHEETSDLQVEELPGFLREDVVNGIKRSSLAEARATVADLEARTLDFGTQGTQRSDGGSE